jgi:hypothetical protein
MILDTDSIYIYSVSLLCAVCSLASLLAYGGSFAREIGHSSFISRSSFFTTLIFLATVNVLMEYRSTCLACFLSNFNLKMMKIQYFELSLRLFVSKRHFSLVTVYHVIWSRIAYPSWNFNRLLGYSIHDS